MGNRTISKLYRSNIKPMGGTDDDAEIEMTQQF